MPDNENTVALTLRLTSVQHQRLRSTSYIVRRPISELIREAIDGHHWHATGLWCDECPDAAKKVRAAVAAEGDKQAREAALRSLAPEDGYQAGDF